VRDEHTYCSITVRDESGGGAYHMIGPGGSGIAPIAVEQLQYICGDGQHIKNTGSVTVDPTNSFIFHFECVADRAGKISVFIEYGGVSHTFDEALNVGPKNDIDVVSLRLSDPAASQTITPPFTFPGGVEYAFEAHIIVTSTRRR